MHHSGIRVISLFLLGIVCNVVFCDMDIFGNSLARPQGSIKVEQVQIIVLLETIDLGFLDAWMPLIKRCQTMTIIYQGADPLISTQIDATMPPYIRNFDFFDVNAIDFGNSLMKGYRFDPNGYSAYYFARIVGSSEADYQYLLYNNESLLSLGNLTVDEILARRAVFIDKRRWWLSIKDNLVLQVVVSVQQQWTAENEEEYQLWLILLRRRFGFRNDCDALTGAYSGNTATCIPSFLPKASRSSNGPGPDSNSTCALLTLVHNEKQFLPIFLRYYNRHIRAQDIFLLVHNTTDGSTAYSRLPSGVHTKNVSVAKFSYEFANRVVEEQSHLLFIYGYKCYIFVEVDEILIPDPDIYPGGLRDYLRSFTSSDSHADIMRAKAYHVAHDASAEPELIPSTSVLAQRHWAKRDHLYDKPFLTKLPLRYEPGFHFAHYESELFTSDLDVPTDLYMYHLHYVSEKYCQKRYWHQFVTLEHLYLNDSSLVSKAQLNGTEAKRWTEFEHAPTSCLFALLGDPDVKSAIKYELIPERFRNVSV